MVVVLRGRHNATPPHTLLDAAHGRGQDWRTVIGQPPYPPGPMPPPRPRGAPALPAVVFTFLASVVVGGGLGAGVALLRGIPLTPEGLGSDPLTMGVSSAATSATLIAAALVCVGRGATPRWQALRMYRERLRALDILLAAVGVMSLGAVIDAVSWLLGVRGESTVDLIGDLVADASWPAFFALLLVIAIGPGLGEEMFFRGYLQTRLLGSQGRWKAIVIAALVFGVFHLDPVHSPMAFCMGIYLGWVAEREDGIATVMVVHAINNGVSVVLSRFLPGGEPTLVENLVTLGVGSALGLLVTYILIRRQPDVALRRQGA